MHSSEQSFFSHATTPSPYYNYYCIFTYFSTQRTIHRYNASQYTALLASAGEDCSVKLWRIYFSGDY